MNRAPLLLLSALTTTVLACSTSPGDSDGTGNDSATPPPATAGSNETASPMPAPDSRSTPSTSTPAQVVRVIDGDTIEVQADGRTVTVRYIGVDTPETSSPNTGVECYGREASEANRRLVEGKTVALERDVSETDRFGRLLRYVYVGDAMVNETLVREGYAIASTFPPDVKHQDRFLAAQREAREAGRGLWSACGGADTPATVSPPSGSNCDGAYPGVCIPSPPPDLDCADVPHARFAVRPPDPHRFDADLDGIGCE